jgi:hypothetical protein
MDAPAPILPGPDGPSPPPLWRELIDGTAGPIVKLAVCLAMVPLFAGVGLVASFVIAGLMPGGMRQYGPDDDVVGVVLVVCTLLYIAAIAWVWTRQRRRHKALWKALAYTGGVIVAAIILGGLIDATLRRPGEILIVAIVMLGIAAVLLIWIHALRGYARYTPPTYSADGLLDVRCPACRYRMVGLHESRCPECGTSYTLDGLLGQQDFITKAKRREGQATINVSSAGGANGVG